jgi:Fe(3+) dicitrate transport protein
LQTDDVVVVGEQLKDPAEAPVEAFTVSEEDLKRQQPLSANDVLQRVPGVTVRAEEGMGLRPNIGFRGLSPDRSRAVLVLEDGVPVQMMPYDYPELYVAPRIERMRSVEVVRGAGSIIYGPRTIGGVVNFVTLAPPPELKLVAEARGGTGGYYFGYASAGDTVGRVGYLVTAMHQAFDGPRKLGLSQTDLMGKVAVDLRDAGELQVKLQFYDEDSHSTTLGLTSSQYDAGKLTNYAKHDRFPVRRYAAQVTHQIDFSSKVNLATTGYFNVTTRDWWRQNYLRKSAIGARYERIIGPQGQVYGPNSEQGTNDGSSLFFLNSNVGHLRRFIVGGVEPRLRARYSTRAMQGELITGVRLHYEHSAIRDVAGGSATARSGAELNDQGRQVMALAAYARPTFEFFHPPTIPR